MVLYSRRGFMQLALVGGAVTFFPEELQAETQVPIRVQADLLVKVAAYDAALVERPGDRKVLLFTKEDATDGSGAPRRMETELASVELIAGRPHSEELVPYLSPVALAETCRKKSAAIAYLPPGLGSKIRTIARALEGTQVLTVAARAEYVKHGAVVGFDLVSGKPQLLVHLGQARKQRVDFKPELLRLAKVYR